MSTTEIKVGSTLTLQNECDDDGNPILFDAEIVSSFDECDCCNDVFVAPGETASIAVECARGAFRVWDES